jgi:hypothetical protein
MVGVGVYMFAGSKAARDISILEEVDEEMEV